MTLLPLLVLAAAQTPTQTDTRPVTLRLGPQGEILGWLVAKEPRTPYGVEGGVWRFAYAPPRDGVDLARVLGGQNTHALAATTLVSDRARRATLLFGTDDGGTLSLNGATIWRKTVVRGVRRDEERVELDLRAGENALVFRVDQGVGGWGFVARLENGEGVASRVGLRMEGDFPEIRMARSLPGVFDAEGARRYAETVRKARLWDRRVGDGKLFERIALSHPGGFTDAGVLNAHFADHEAKIAAAYAAARAPSVARAQNPGPLLASVKAEPGIRVMPGGRQFADAKGRPFVPIGYNHNPDWTELNFASPLNGEGYDPKRTDRWFAKLRANGVNVVRMMAETPPSGNLEDEVGTFSPEHMTWLDNVVTSARRHDVRIMLTPYDTFWMNLRADASPYWTANGGPVDPARKIEWYTAPRLREAHKRRNRWLIDRYGNLDTIFVWEPMNEADIWWDPTPEQLTAWADDVVADARAYQKSRWGVERLFSISAAEPMPKGGLAEFMFRRNDLDLANTHLYIGASKRQPKDPADVIATEAEGIRHALGEIRDGRPYVDTENGPIDDWIEDPKIDDAVFHDQSWAHLASGGAGSGFRWPYRGPHHLTDGMLAHLKRMRTFADAVDWSRFAGETKPLDLPELAGLGLSGTGYATPGGTIVFVARRAGTPLSRSIVVPVGATPAGRAARVYDTMAGKWSGESLSLPAFTLKPGVRSACAVWIAR